MRRVQSGPLAVLTMVMAAIIATGTLGGQVASAATTVVVTPTNPQGWSTADTRPGGTVDFIYDTTSPLPSGALQLTNAATGGNANTLGGAKAQYLHAASTPLGDVTELGYSTKRISGSTDAAASYQFLVQLDGTAASFTTLVYEPYQNGTVDQVAWQSWDVDAGQFWSSRNATDATVLDGSCTVKAGGGGTFFYTLANLQAACPNAVVVGFGVNVGSGNPNWNVYTDAVNFNGTIYDFQYPVGPPTAKNDCKNGGWETFDTPRAFTNQGDCIQFVNTGK